tara:strand:+ start:2964 stop:3518 length:555 start_codon:yes stop_codon:yes gene_type:complete
MSTLEVNSIQPLSSGTTVTLGASGKTFNIPSGCTITNSGTATGFGKVLQVLTNEFTTTGGTTSSSSFIEVGPQLQITPTASNTKMLVSVQGGSAFTATDKNIMWTIFRDISGGASTNLGGSDGLYKHFANSSFLMGSVAMQVLDTHGTTSNVEYKCFVRTSTGSAVTIQDSPTKTIMTVIELEA